MWPALPTSDYYGDSVTLGLAPVRPSHVPLVLNVSSVTEAPHSSPSIGSLPIALPVGGGSPQTRTVCPQETLRSRRCSSERAFAPLGIGIQAMQLSPYHAGLAGRHLQRLPVTPAFPICSCPLRLSPSGQSDDPGAFLRAPLDCVKDSTPRSAAHALNASGSSSHDFATPLSRPWTTRARGRLYRFSRRRNSDHVTSPSRRRRDSRCRQILRAPSRNSWRLK
jgi:hypothetical protein